MFLLSFARIIKFSFQDIGRNIWLSIVTVTILILALFSVNILLVVNVISQASVNTIKNRIDTSLYLTPDASDSDIASLKDTISQLPQVKGVQYISKAEALQTFTSDNKDNPDVLSALRELGNNPLTPSLVVQPKNPDDVDEFTNSLNNINSDIIQSRDFTNNKALLAKINDITAKVSKIGIIMSSIFLFITLLVVFNSVRVAIYTHRKEIGIMKLVGASNSFVYMPFLLSSLIYALLGVAIIILLFYPFLSLLQPYIDSFFLSNSVNIISYFNIHFVKIFGLEFVGIAVINLLASFIAVRKYTKV